VSALTRDRLLTGERGKVRAFAAVSVVMLFATILLRLSTPSPFAPRVHVRWAPEVSPSARAELERRFALATGEQRDATTWEYDLLDLEPASVRSLIAHPAVADTHYLDRDAATVTSDAPAGSIRLADRRFAGWVHSPLFDWFVLLWASSLIVSGVWLASPPEPGRF